jgi:MTH538 TIR-like domain (DUF1863)
VNQQHATGRGTGADVIGPKYAVFISYASEDRREAIRLQRDLERFPVPRKLVGEAGSFGTVSPRIGRVFLDRTDLSAAPALTATIVSALGRSEALVVLCSKSAAAAERWVNREIATYRELHPKGRIFAVIIRDEPPGCFPSQLLSLGGDEPLAADMRREGDGRREGLLKLVSGILGVDFEQLRRRRAAAQRLRRRVIVGIVAAYAVTMTIALVGVTRSSVRLMECRGAAIALQAKQANALGRHDSAMLLAATAMPAPGSRLEPQIPLAEAQALRALMANRLERAVLSRNANLLTVDPSHGRAFLAPIGGPVTAIELPSGQSLPGWVSPAEDAWSLTLSSDSRQLALTTEVGQVVVLDATDGSVKMRSEPSGSIGRSVAFSRDGHRLVIGGADGRARIFDVVGRQWIGQSPPHNGMVMGVSFSADGSRVLSGSGGGTLIEWDADTGALLGTHDNRGDIDAI